MRPREPVSEQPAQRPDTGGCPIVAGRRGKVKQLWCGLEWASKTHAVCVVDDSGGIRARFEVPNTGKSFAGLVKRLLKLKVAGVAIERADGPLVEALLEAKLTVHMVPPSMVKAVRARYGAAGAKSDPGDAYV